MRKSTKETRKIYLDYASSALSRFPNSGAIHALGVKEKNRLENARTKIAKILNARGSEIVFTSGATESNNLAIQGVVLGAGLPKPPHIITTNIEHASVLEVCKYLEKTKQARITFVEVEPSGIVDPKKIKKALTKETVLVSVMYVNNEIGTIQPIQEIAKEIRHFKNLTRLRHPLLAKERVGERCIYPIFHTDATQAVNYLPIDAQKLGVDLMSFNAAKIYGPKGIGALYVKRNTPIKKIMFGGEQEGGLRPGTENVEGIVAFASALEIAEKIKSKEVKRLTKLRDYFFSQLQKMSRLNLDVGLVINGDPKKRLPNNVNITIPKIPSDLLVIELSARGIMTSAKSACKSGDGKDSHVILALNQKNGVPAKTLVSAGSLRFSLGRETTKKDIDYTVKSLSEILTKLKKWYN